MHIVVIRFTDSFSSMKLVLKSGLTFFLKRSSLPICHSLLGPYLVCILLKNYISGLTEREASHCFSSSVHIVLKTISEYSFFEIYYIHTYTYYIKTINNHPKIKDIFFLHVPVWINFNIKVANCLFLKLWYKNVVKVTQYFFHKDCNILFLDVFKRHT